MTYKELGATGLKVSEIGLGCEGFLEKDDAFTQDMFALALEQGVNCMDLYSPDPDMHRRVGRAVGSRRSAFIYQAHLCTVWQDGQYKATRDMREIVPSFEGMLKHLGTDYVDIGMIHYVDSAAVWKKVSEGGILDYVRKLKERGAIGHIGMSSHNPYVALEAVKSGAIEVLMFSVNPCYDLLPGDEDVNKLFEDASYEKPLFNLDPVREELYETCQRMGVGITVMKVYGGGDLLTDRSPAGRAMTPAQCIHYALTRPAVASIMVGFTTPEHVAEAVAYETAGPEERDYASVLAGAPRHAYYGQCTYCGHCAPCPKGIDIPTVNKFYDLAAMQPEVPDSLREHYRALDVRADACIACHACESRCPFGVKVAEKMAQAAELFGC